MDGDGPGVLKALGFDLGFLILGYDFWREKPGCDKDFEKVLSQVGV